MKKVTLIAALYLISVSVFAQKQAPLNWFHLDAKTDKYPGVSANKAHAELLKDKPSKTIVVAVLDGGTEELHEDLQSVLWVNAKEIAGNNVDDDRNGYVDDVHGWNFIGGNKENVKEDNLEVTRLYRSLGERFKQLDTNQLDGIDKTDFEYFKQIRTAYNKGYNEYAKSKAFYQSLLNGLNTMQKNLGADEVTVEAINAYMPKGADDAMAKQIMVNGLGKKKTGKVTISAITVQVEEGLKQISGFVDYHYNLAFDPRSIVGDNYTNTKERYYGNNKVSGPNGDHGSHVAGIIGAARNNQIGMDGIANNIKIMIVRVVPDGDERDKDVANAIKYAVDNGASVINMSFGKSYSPYKSAVDEAILYAQTKDVLLVHGAGNDGKNVDVEPNFPCDRVEGNEITNWLEIGASSWKTKKYITADFSNYGKQNVDVFAPGVDIYSCIPESKYASFDGTSMAAPVTAGVAAVLRSYYPQLTAAQIKQIIIQSATPVKGKVNLPGDKKKVKMSELCVAGGIVNLYQAVLMADKMTASK